MRSKQKKWGRNLLSGLWIVMLLYCSQIIWASDIQINAAAGIDGQNKYNRYIPITITLDNAGDDFTGRIQIVIGNSTTEYSEEVSIAAGGKQTYIIPIKDQDGRHNLARVRLLDKKENEVLSKDVYITVNVLDSDQLVVGVLSDDASRVNYLRGIDLRLDISCQTHTIKLEASNIDEKSKNLDVMDIIVINDYDTSQLLPEQLQAIKKWIEQGGTLIVGTGVNANKTLSGLTKEVIPVTIKGTEEQTVQYLDDTITLDLTQLEIASNEEKVIHNSQFYTNLYSAFSMGTGKIIIAKYDLGLEPMASYSHNDDLWREILTDELDGKNIDSEDQYYWSFQGLTKILSTYLLDHKILVAFLIIYIVVMGIGAYFILKKKQKKEYIWIIAPILSIITTIIFFGLSKGSRIEDFMVNQLDIIKLDEFKNASKVSCLGVLNTQGNDLMISETDEVEIGTIDNPNRYYYRDEDEDVKITQSIQYLGGKLQYQERECGVYDTRIVITKPVQTEAPHYETSIRMEGNNYHISLLNNSEQDIDQLFMVSNDRVWNLGSLAKGEKLDKVVKDKDGENWYELIYNDTSELNDSDLGNIMEMLQEEYYRTRYNKPIYIAIMENGESVLPIVQGSYGSDFYYTAVLGELEMSLIEENGEIIYPYNYFEPYIVSQSGNGFYDDYAPIITLVDSLEVVLEYPIKAESEVNWISFGSKALFMENYYYTDLKGEVYLYNYNTKQYELITIPKSDKGYRIEGDDIQNYLKDDVIRMKIVGQNEDCGIVPSIQVGGTSNATN